MADEDVNKSEAAGEAAAGDEAGEQPAMSEEELRQKLEEHFREQDVGNMLVQFLIGLSTLAYVKMGLTEDTTQYKDLEQAGLAIDSFKALLEASGDRLPDQDAQALSGALASMQMTYVKAKE